MTIKLFTPTSAHAPALAQIMFDAFGSLQDRHGVERDFESPEIASMAMGMFMSWPHMVGVAARVEGGGHGEGELVGSNFLLVADPVAAVGPITVKPGGQARGVGKALMRAVMDEAVRRKISQVRLLQEAINTTSLSLYTKLGFDWRDGCALMRTTGMVPGAPSGGGVIRPLGPEDLDGIGRVSTHHYHSTRRNEAAMLLAAGFPAVGLEVGGTLTGYVFPGFLGHGFAPTPGELVNLIAHAASIAPPMFHKVIVPMSQNELHRTLLERGARTVKLLNYMTVGAFERPRGAWVPSIQC